MSFLRKLGSLISFVQVFESSGEQGLSFYNRHLSGSRDAVERFAVRAGLDPEREIQRALYSYTDLDGNFHIAAAQAHEMARAFTVTEPRTVLDG